MASFTYLDEEKPSAGFTYLDDAPPKQKQNTGIVGDIGTALKRGVLQMPGMATGLADIAAAPVSIATGVNRPVSRAADWIGEQTGFQPGKWAEAAGAEYSPEMQQAQQNVEQAKGFFPTLGAVAQNPRMILPVVGESLPSTIAGGLVARGAMGAVAGAEKLAALHTAAGSADAAVANAARRGLLKSGAIAAGIGEGAVTAGQQMAQTGYDVDPALAAGAAIGAGVGTGIIGGLSGRLASSALGRKLGLSDIETSMAAGTLGENAGKAGAAGFARRIGAGAIQEGLLEEAPQSYQEQVWQNLAAGKPLTEGAAEAAALGTVAGGVMGAGFNIANGPLSKAVAAAPGAAVPPAVPVSDGQQAPAAAGIVAGKGTIQQPIPQFTAPPQPVTGGAPLEQAPTAMPVPQATQNAPAAPGSPSPVSAADTPLPAKQAEAAGAPIQPPQGPLPSADQAEIAIPPAQGPEAAALPVAAKPANGIAAALQYPQQVTEGGGPLAQQAADMPLGRFGASPKTADIQTKKSEPTPAISVAESVAPAPEAGDGKVAIAQGGAASEIKSRLGIAGALVTPQQPTFGGAPLEQTPTEMPLGKYGNQKASEPAATQQVPPRIRSVVAIAIDRLRSISDSLDNVVAARGNGAILAGELAGRQEEISKAKAKLDQFRTLAAQKGIDAEAVIKELGGEPDFAKFAPRQTPSYAPQQPLSGAGEQQPVASLQSAYNEAKAKLEAIGPEPRKPSTERQAFGTNGKAGAPADVVAKYEASVKAYVSWKAKYNRLKKAEVEASNALFAAKKAAPSEQIQYDKNGYDSEGYDSKGYDREGFNRKGFDKFGYDEYGFDKDGVDEGGIGRDDDFYMSDAQIAKANSALGFRRDAGAGGWPVENDYLEKIDTANAYAVADKQGFVYRGLNMPDTQAYIARGDDLVLIGGNNFDDQTAGISFTPFLDIAKDYATRTQTAAVRHPDGAIVKIDMAALRRIQLEEEGDGELAVYDRKDLTIPSGKWEITYNPDAEGPFTLAAKIKPKPRQQPLSGAGEQQTAPPYKKATARSASHYRVRLKTPLGNFDVFVEKNKDSSIDDYKRDAKNAFAADSNMANLSGIAQISFDGNPEPVSDVSEMATVAKNAKWARIAKVEKAATQPQPKPRQQPQPATIMRRDDLVGAIMRVTGGDGIASNMALTIAGDTAGRGLSKLRGLFTNRGTIDLGEVATRLREDEGFDVRDGEHLSELIRAASFGDTAVSMGRASRDQDTAEDKRHRDYIRQNAKKLKIKSVAVKFTDLEQRVIAALTRRHERAVELLDERAKKRFDAALEESYALLPEDVVDAVLVDLSGRGLSPREFWNQATETLRYMVADARAQKEQEELNAIEGAEPDWLKDDDGRGNQPAGGRGEADRVAEEARGEAGFSLAAQTHEEIAAAEAAAKEAKQAEAAAAAAEARKEKAAQDKAEKDRRAAEVLKEREAAKKAEVDKAAEEFALGQAAPEPVVKKVTTEEAKGQKDIFAAPAPAAKPEPKIVEHVTAKGKTLRGTIRKDLTLDQAIELDRFTFKKDGGYFIRVEPVPGQPAAEIAAIFEKPNKSAEQAAKLRAAGEKVVADAEQATGRDRLTNTAKRAREASIAEAQAAQHKVIGETMIRIADAIEDGTATALYGITARTQIELLDLIMANAIYKTDDKKGGYALTQKNKGRPFSEDDLAAVKMPGTAEWRDGAKASLTNAIAGKRGAPALRDEIIRSRAYSPELHGKVKAIIGDDEIKSAVGWFAVEDITRAARLARAGITNTDQLRSAITEYSKIRAAKAETNKAKALERALVGQKVGIDFFPTPKVVAADMVRKADIRPGMRVLEPSAGNGNIAEAIQAAGVKPDVIEVSLSLREILDAKGFNIVGQDFMEATGKYDRIVMNPPFSNRMDAEHVQKAYSMLNHGGKIVAIMGEGVFFGTDRKAAEFRDWLDSVGGTSDKLPAGTFSDRTLMATTGTNARLVEIEKPSDLQDSVRFSQESPQDNQPSFYSQLSNAIASARVTAQPAAQWKAWINGNAGNLGIKKDEIEWSGILDYLDVRGKDKVTKAEIADYLSGNGVRVEDVVKGAPDSRVDAGRKLAESQGHVWDDLSARDQGRYIRSAAGEPITNRGETDTKFDGYWQDSYKGGIPGTYREILVTLPVAAKKPDFESYVSWAVKEYGVSEAEARKDWDGGPMARAYAIARDSYNEARIPFQSSHWDEPNVLVHIRTDEVIGADGKRYLRVGEIQSDWGQKGKKDGFKGRSAAEIEADLIKIPDGDPAARPLLDELKAARDGVPQAPFVTDTRAWAALGIKRAIIHAINSGVDGVVFGTGEQNANLYNLSKRVNEVSWRTRKGNKNATIELKNGDQLTFHLDKSGKVISVEGTGENQYNGKRFDEVIGKDVADKVMSDEDGVMSGEGLNIGGLGMRAFYDQIIPSVANDVLKKVGGGKVGSVEVEAGESKWWRETNGYRFGPFDTKREAQGQGRLYRKADAVEQPGFAITPQMRAKIQSQGVPLFSFAGQQSATADQFQLDRAKQLLADGANANSVRQQTGWFKGVDGKWRYEIDDSGASLQNMRMEDGLAMRATSLETILDHPALFAAYPALRDMDVQITIDPDGQEGGSFERGSAGDSKTFGRQPEIKVNARTEEKALSTLLHEIQHGIQNVEGFASGGSPRTISAEMTGRSDDLAKAGSALNSAITAVRSANGNQAYWDILAAVRADGYRYSHIAFQLGTIDDDLSDVAMLVSEIAKKKGYKELFDAAEAYSVIADNLIKPGQGIDRDKAAYEKYRKLAGEVESRNVQQRQNFPADKRKYSDPLGTQDVAPEDVIVVFNGKDAKDAPAPANTTRASAMAAVGASPADAAVIDMAAEGKSAQEILSFLSKASRRPFNRILASVLMRIGVSSTVSVDPVAGWRNNRGRNGAKFAASYSPKTDTVALYTPREAERHVLHELVHAATLKAIARGGPAARQMQSIFDYVQRTGTMSDQYGMGNFSRFPNETDAQFKKRMLDEFTAELFTNPQFQLRLKQLPAPSGSKLKSAWDWIVRVIANLLGLKTKAQETALDRALSVGAALLQENAALTMPKGERFSQEQPFSGREVAATPLKPGTTTLMVDGVERPALNSNGNPIHWSEEGVRNFWRWFGSSDAVDPWGRPLILYHFTDNDIGGTFKQAQRKARIVDKSTGNWARLAGDGIYYFTSDQDYRRSVGWGGTRFKHVVYLKLINPKLITREESDRLFIDNAMEESIKANGHDGTRSDDGVEITVFNSNQIKSATANTGAFSPEDPDIRYSLATNWPTSAIPQAKAIRDTVATALRSDANTSWITPFNTQYHKAEKWAADGKPIFKRVFNLVQQFLGDVSKYAVMAQNAAPTLLHEWRTVSDVKAALSGGDLVGRKHRADIAAVAMPLYDGTLYGGGNPMNGIKWSDERLRTKYKLTDRQIKLYHEALAAVNVSMDEMAKSVIAQHAKREKVGFDSGMDIDDMSAGVISNLEDKKQEIMESVGEIAQESVNAQIADLKEMDRPDEAEKLKREFDKAKKDAKADLERLDKTIGDINGIVAKNKALQAAGYFPLMRFGRHTVTAKDAEGKVQFFGMYDGIPLVPGSGQAEANRVAAQLKEEFPDWDVTTGIVNAEKHKLYQGVNLDALQLFAEHMEKDDVEPFQEFVRMTTNNRSAQRRMLHRKGTPGFDKDVRRTMAQFITSNARATSSNYHTQDMLRAAAEAEKDGGDIGAEAIKLVKYVQDPIEEAQALRGFLFFNFLGGSIASAMVNLTQTPAMTLPYLSKFEQAPALMRRTMAAARMAAGKPEAIADQNLRYALMRAELDGVTAPQEIHQLMATAANNIFAGSRAANILLRGWGAPFSMAESFNRRIAFITAFKIGEGMGNSIKSKTGFDNAFDFAEDVVKQTQGIYNKGNRMNIGRGAVGATLVTFKQYSVMYLELLKRLPPKQRAIMVGVLLLSAGAGGLPGVDDLEDLWDTVGQWLGYATNSKRSIRNSLTEFAGAPIADVVLNGVLSRMGIDLHSRLGMQNLIPGTGILKQSSTDKGRDIEEFFGPAASVVKSVGDALENMATGRPDKAAMAVSPVAVRNAVLGGKMASTGFAQDARGRNTVPVNEVEAFAKGIGFNPKAVAEFGSVKRDLAQDQRLVGVKREEFAAAMADAILNNDPEARLQAIKDLQEWNQNNPFHRVTITPESIAKRVRDARAEGATRMLRSLPRGMRTQAAEELRQ